MTTQTRAKQERIIEAVRRGLEGDAAVEFIQQSGHAATTAVIARHLQIMGGRRNIQDLIDAGKSNIEIIEACLHGGDLEKLRPAPPTQPELFAHEVILTEPAPSSEDNLPLYDTTKISLHIASDLYEAIRVAAKAENKTQAALIAEILTAALSRMPERDPGHGR